MLKFQYDYITKNENMEDLFTIILAIVDDLYQSYAPEEVKNTAACLGRVSDEAQLVLNHFGFEPPTLISNVYTQVQNLDFDKPPILSAAVTVDRAWNELQKRKELRAIPVANDDGTLSGLISREDIASYNMELNNSCILDKVPLFNVLSVLEGKVINEAGEYLDAVSGEVVLAIPESRRTAVFPSSDCVVICGDQPDMIRQALEQNVNCMILCRTELAPELKKSKHLPVSSIPPVMRIRQPDLFSSPPRSAESARPGIWYVSIWRIRWIM